MLKKVIYSIFFLLLLVSSVWLLYIGFTKITKNQSDPLWSQLETLPHREFKCLEDQPDSLQLLFLGLQKDSNYKKIPALELIGQPFLPTMEYGKFSHFIEYLLTTKRAVVAGVTGSGKTTLIDRASRFIAVDENRIMKIECVENLEAEYHRNYIGYYTEKGFHPGRLLKFLEQCQLDSLHNYVLLIDDIDKIYPATLFGAAIWNELDNSSYKNGIDGYIDDIQIPSNLFILSITHEGPGSTIALNAEHFRRLGQNGTYPVGFNAHEYFLHLNKKASLKNAPDSVWTDVHKLIYFFEKSNRMIAERYGPGFSLGQWSDIRKMKSSADIPLMQQMFISHVNSFNPAKSLQENDFEPIIYSLNNNGLIPDSSILAKIYYYVVEVGLFGELSAAIIFGLLSLLAGLFVFYRKRLFIRKMIQEIALTPEDLKQGKLSYDEARGKLLLIQDKVRNCIVKRKVNFSEANYILLNINEILKQLEEHKQMKSVSADLEKMLQRFTDDGILDDKEYAMLNDFLESMRSGISAAAYSNFKEVIADIYRKSLAIRNSKSD